MNFCHGCSYKCHKPLVMLAHMRTCDTKCTKCSLCDADHKNIKEFCLHLNRHDDIKPFFCVECDRRFLTRTALSLHLPTHSNVTPFICSFCGKGFKWRTGLSTHQAVHAKEKKLLCDECGYSTAHMNSLRTHKLNHVSRSLKCPTVGCNFKTRRKENLKNHLSIHCKKSAFVCEVCGHRFSQNKNLKVKFI